LEKREMRRLLIAVFFIAPLTASTIITVTCQAGATYTSQSDPSSAQCAASDFPYGDSANANGAVAIGLLSGFTSVWSNDNAVATADASFDYFFAATTTLTWNVSVNFGGPYGYVLLDLGGLKEGYQGALITSWEGTITETLGPGDYTFSAYAYVSDQGSASFSVTDPSLPAPSPEPGTMALVALVLLWGFRAVSSRLSAAPNADR
jgi:hypothetical protein